MLGVVLACIVLEIALRLGGALFFYVQEERNQKAIHHKGGINVLCLGESTTALGEDDSYPSQLQQVLDKSSAGRFTVINKGVPAINSDYILAHLKENLDRYHPRVVVLMMGINDYFQYKAQPPQKPLPSWQKFFQELRVYKLYTLMAAHLTARIQGNSQEMAAMHTNPPEINSTPVAQALQEQITRLSQQNDTEANRRQLAALYAALAGWYNHQQRRTEAVAAFEAAIQYNPRHGQAYGEMGKLLLEQLDLNGAQRLLEVAVKLAPDKDSYWQALAKTYYQQGIKTRAFIIYEDYIKRRPVDMDARFELGEWYMDAGLYAQAQGMFEEVLHHNPQSYDAYAYLAKMFELSARPAQAEDVLKKGVIFNHDNPRFYELLSAHYQRQNRPDLAKAYEQQAYEHRHDQYYAPTIENFHRITDMVLSRGSSLIIMQYPLRSITPLKELVGSHKGVYFVGNKDNFEQALRGAKYWDYFTDIFAGDFGHCTQKGNALIASHLAEVILNI